MIDDWAASLAFRLLVRKNKLFETGSGTLYWARIEKVINKFNEKRKDGLLDNETTPELQQCYSRALQLHQQSIFSTHATMHKQVRRSTPATPTTNTGKSPVEKVTVLLTFTACQLMWWGVISLSEQPQRFHRGEEGVLRSLRHISASNPP